jgi:hypothetical protein
LIALLVDAMFTLSADDGNQRLEFFLTIRTLIHMQGDPRQNIVHIRTLNDLLGQALKLFIGCVAVTAGVMFLAETVSEFSETIQCHLPVNSTKSFAHSLDDPLHPVLTCRLAAPYS